MPFIKQSTKTTLPSHSHPIICPCNETHTYKHTHTRVHTEETCTRKTIKQKLEQKLIKFMSPEICFTSKTSNCVEFGAEIKCTWPLRLSVTQIQMGRQARGKEWGTRNDRGSWKTLKNFSTHTCTHSLAINLLFQQDKGDVVRALLQNSTLLSIHLCVFVCVCVGVCRCLLQFGLHLSKICLSL